MAVDVRSRATQYDHSDMAAVIHGLPDQIEYALSDPDFPTPALDRMRFEKAIVLGLGGSALPADVLNDAFEDRLVHPVTVQRHYELPRGVDEQTLVILSSFSGNTEETLEPLKTLSVSASNVVVMTAGGALAEEGRKRNYPVIRIPREREVDGFQPRSATGYMVTYLARLLTQVGILEDPGADLAELVRFLRASDFREDGESTARWLASRHPVFYTDQSHERSVARIAKIKFNENAKRPAFFNALPEANHNEMIGFSSPFGEFGLLYLKDPDSLPQIHRRFEVMKTVLEDKGFSHVESRHWEMQGTTRLERIFSALVFSDWISYSVALLGGIDPTPVHLVESFKQALNAVTPE
jgi:glucose/mannose-6-phosphate isomerase